MRMLLCKEFLLSTSPGEVNSWKLKTLFAIPRRVRVALCGVLEHVVFRDFGRTDNCYIVAHNLSYIMKKEAYNPSKKLVFENHSFRVPGKYDYYLTEMYGDYMTPPPEEERGIGHESSLGKIIYDTHTDFRVYINE